MALTLNRRALFGAVALAPAAPALLAGMGAAVVTLHMDQPFVDRTGRSRPYRPPAGYGGQLSEATIAAQVWL